MSETAKWRQETVKYCQGNGVDLGCGGDPIVPRALAVDLPPAAAETYTTTDFERGVIQWRGDVRRLPWFADDSLDYVYSSHVLEDFSDWREVLVEWGRVVRPGGYLVILVPDQQRWAMAVGAGQPPNHNHANEFDVGQLGECLRISGRWEVLEDRLIAPEGKTPTGTPEYTILFVARKYS